MRIVVGVRFLLEAHLQGCVKHRVQVVPRLGRTLDVGLESILALHLFTFVRCDTHILSILTGLHVLVTHITHRTNKDLGAVQRSQFLHLISKR